MLQFRDTLWNQVIEPAYPPVVKKYNFGSTYQDAQILELKARIASLEEEKILSNQRHLQQDERISELTQVINAQDSQIARNKRAVAHFGAHSRNLELKLLKIKDELQKKNQETLKMEKNIEKLEKKLLQCDSENYKFIGQHDSKAAVESCEIYPPLHSILLTRGLIQEETKHSHEEKDYATAQKKRKMELESAEMREYQDGTDQMKKKRKLNIGTKLLVKRAR